MDHRLFGYDVQNEVYDLEKSTNSPVVLVLDAAVIVAEEQG